MDHVPFFLFCFCLGWGFLLMDLSIYLSHPLHKQRDGKSVYWSSFDISKEGELKVTYVCRVMVQTSSVVPHWVSRPGFLYSST